MKSQPLEEGLVLMKGQPERSTFGGGVGTHERLEEGLVLMKGQPLEEGLVLMKGQPLEEGLVLMKGQPLEEGLAHRGHIIIQAGVVLQIY